MEEMSTAALQGLEEEFGPLLWLLQDQNWEKERKGGLTLFTWKVNSMADGNIDVKFIWQHIREWQRYF